MNARARVRTGFLRAFVLVLGVAALWTTRDALNPDGVAYLDASDVYLSGSLASGTGYWSPLYPLMLAGARALLGRGPERETAITQGVNLIAFLLAFLALEYLLYEIRRVTRRRRPGAPTPNDFIWGLLVYAFFVATTVAWVRLWMATPDMTVLAIVLAIAGLCVRLADGLGGWGAIVMLGVVLGLGYLAKAAMFPIAFVVLGTLAVVHRNRLTVVRLVVAGAIFLAISGPQIVYASRLKGSPTFGDVGRLNYLWFIANVPGPVSPAFALPARLPSPDSVAQRVTPLDPVHDPHPAVYDINAPIPGTLPIWYDAGYWYRGVTAPLMPLAIVRALVRHARVYLEVFGFLMVGGVAALLAGPTTRREVAAMRPDPILLVPAVAGLVMYALVLVQTRYVAPFALLFLAALAPPWMTDAASRRLRVGLVVGAVTLVPLVVFQAKVEATAWRGAAHNRATVAATLNARGIGRGSRIGFIGDAYDALWARTARVRFVSLVPGAEAGAFWGLDPSARTAVLARMQQQGAEAIVAETPAPGVSTEGWERLPPAGPPKPQLIVYGGLR
jgi:4-amino-4-deoxy-L-arabinose transferase-like glycosyltransferase